tara:strand:+ start:53 stop:1549 length:1497 start_codon:yes stop_codon:yes gene_type:complete
MGSIGKSLKKVVKKIARPKVLIPLALMAATGGMSGMFAGGKGAMLGKAAIGGTGTAGGSLLPFLGEKGLTAATPGLFGTGGKLALGKGTLAKGIMSGLANPLSKKGLATYGGLAALGMGMLGDKPEKAEDPIDRKALNQANYNMMRMYGQNAGYTNEDINTIYGPLGEMMGGGHTEVPADPSQRRRIQFPGTNYPIYTTQGAANGGRIERPGFWLGGLLKGLTGGDPEDVEASDTDHYRPTKDQQDLLSQVRYLKGIGHEDPDEIIGLIGGGNLSEEDKAFLLERLTAPEVKANGGRIGFSWGGWSSPEDADDHAQRMFNKEYKDLTPDELDDFEEEMMRLRNKFSDSGNMQMASAPDPMAERADTLENMALEQYGKSLDKLSPKEIEMLEFNLDEMNMNDFYNTGGRVHRNIGGIMNAPAVTTPGQAMMPPKGTQWDGRQGGFMPMGEVPQADDVPAMLSKDEFVMTRDAVKAAGNGDVNKGAQVMYDLMNNLEAKV